MDVSLPIQSPLVSVTKKTTDTTPTMEPSHFLFLKTMTDDAVVEVRVGFDVKNKFSFFYNRQKQKDEKSNQFPKDRSEFQIHQGGIVYRHGTGQSEWEHSWVETPHSVMNNVRWEMNEEGLSWRALAWAFDDVQYITSIDWAGERFSREDEVKNVYGQVSGMSFPEVLYESMKRPAPHLAVAAKLFNATVQHLTLGQIDQLKEENPLTCKQSKNVFNKKELAFIQSFFAHGDQSIRKHCESFVTHLNKWENMLCY